jgi:hypothetical protein
VNARPNLHCKRAQRPYGLWVLWLSSVAWLGIVTGLLATRLSEWWPLFDTPMLRERLSLPEIGIVLIAAFVPLTFVWLVNAILYQQRETGKQQTAVEEARGVLLAQQEGYEATLKANLCLTRIMNETLEATRSTITYDEFSLKLYFLAKEVLTEASHIDVTVQPGMTVSLFRSPTNFDLSDRQSSVDALFALFENWLRHGVKAVLDGVSRIETMDPQRTAAFLSKVRRLKSAITQLLVTYEMNSLVAARVEGIRLRQVHQLLRAVEAKWEKHISGTPLEVEATSRPAPKPLVATGQRLAK